MARTILVAGKDMPAGAKFADALSEGGRQVVVTAPAETESEQGEQADALQRSAERHQKLIGKASGVISVPWNRGSPISSRTLILNAEAVFKRVDEAVLFFDEALFASRANRLGIEECASACDEMVLSFQYLTLEVLGRFAGKRDETVPCTLVFLLKEGPSAADAVLMPSLHNGAYAIASPVVASAAAAFTSFAENIVALYGDLPYVNIVLVRGDHTMDISANDAEFGKWLCTYMDSLATLKNKLSARKSLTWVKPGAKVQQGGFGLFSKK